MSTINIQELAKQIVSLPLSAAADLREELKTLLNLSDIAISGMPAGPAPQASVEQGPKAAEKTEFDIYLKEVGPNKTSIIRDVRKYRLQQNPNESLGLVEVKNLISQTPAKIFEKVNKQLADEIIKTLKEAGADCVAE